MNVASANTVGHAPTAFMAARASETGGLAVGTQTPSERGGEAAASGFKARYPVVALSFDQDASRLVMLFRDPTTGDAVAQIPSKVVVKQYQEAQIEQRRDERRKFEVIVGGADDGQSGEGGSSSGGGGREGGVAATGAGKSSPSIGAAFLASSSASASASASVVSGGAAGGSVSSTSSASSAPAVSTAGSAPSTGSVNLVI